MKSEIIDLENNEINISKGEENFSHLVRVLRIKNGEEILCSVIPFTMTFDYRCKVTYVDDEKVTLSIEEKRTANELPVNINLYQGISKGDKMEFVIEKAVELGVYSITPVAMEFSVAKIEEKKEVSKLERFNKISRSAAEQSKRNIIPEVRKSLKFEEMLNVCKNDKEALNILFYENAEGIGRTKDIIRKGAKSVNVVIGPEGGFSIKEIEKARDAGFNILSLGDRILRTETAAVTALSILMYEFAK